MRRGADQAKITDVGIDPANKFICCSSDKGTIHIFSIAQEVGSNKKSSLSALGGAIGYFGSSWSFSQFRVKDSNCKCAIMDNKVFAISTQGNYFMSEIQAGEIKIERQANLLEESRE